MVRTRGLVAIAVVVALSVVVVACTKGNEEPLPLATTSTGPAFATSSIVGRSAASISQDLATALAAKDFCLLVAAFDNAVPLSQSDPRLVAAYEDLARTTQAATAFVPTDVADAWPAIIAATAAGARAARQVMGDLGDPTLRAPFVDGGFVGAMSEVETWADTHC